MELLVSVKLAHRMFHGIPWNCSSRRNWHTQSSIEIHGIPWSWSCHRNWRTPNSMEFHGTARVSEIGALLVPWNSMELFVSSKLVHSKFHGIPWNCSCQFHGIPWNLFLLFNGTIGIINALRFKMVQNFDESDFQLCQIN